MAAVEWREDVPGPVRFMLLALAAAGLLLTLMRIPGTA
jgi:hypothetical protein